MLLTAFLTLPARGDAFRSDDKLWINEVTFENFDGSKLNYLVGSNPGSRPLSDIEGLRMTAYPELDAAEKARTAGNEKAMITQYKAARGKAKEPWLKMWLDSRLYLLMEKQPGEAAAAMQAYVNLIEAKAPAKLFAQPPEIAARNLTKDDRTRFHEKFQTLMNNAQGDLAKQLKEMVILTDPKDAPVKPPDPDKPTVTEESVIPLPEFLRTDRRDAVVRHLSRGRFAEALEEVENEIKTAAGGRTAVLLFERGVARFYLAAELEKKDPSKAALVQEQYLDAGLDFMRVAAYFKNSAVAGPSLLELAHVHAKIKRPDVARAQLARAESMIDPDDKSYKDHLEKLKQQLAASEGTP